MSNDELKTWLRQNCSGIYRPARDAADKIEELESALRRCVAEMKYSAETGQPISENRVEFLMAKDALGQK